MLQQEGFIRSAFLFKTYLRLTGANHGLKAGTYFFERKANMLSLASRLKDGLTGIKAKRITFVEGATAHDMSLTLSSQLPDFDAVAFERLASASEGYLSPIHIFLSRTSRPRKSCCACGIILIYT